MASPDALYLIRHDVSRRLAREHVADGSNLTDDRLARQCKFQHGIIGAARPDYLYSNGASVVGQIARHDTGRLLTEIDRKTETRPFRPKRLSRSRRNVISLSESRD